MESADRFRNDQPLLPWLNGIRLNRWRQERRKLRGVWKNQPWYTRWVPFAEDVHLTAGQRTAQEFHSKLGALLVRFKRPDDQGVVRFPRFPCGEIDFEVTRGNFRLEPPRIQLRGTGEWEQHDVVVHDLDKQK